MAVDLKEVAKQILLLIEKYKQNPKFYDSDKNRTLDISEAIVFFCNPWKILIELDRSEEDDTLNVYTSKSVKNDKIFEFLQDLRKVATLNNMLYQQESYDGEISPKRLSHKVSTKESKEINNLININNEMTGDFIVKRINETGLIAHRPSASAVHNAKLLLNVLMAVSGQKNSLKFEVIPGRGKEFIDSGWDDKNKNSFELLPSQVTVDYMDWGNHPAVNEKIKSLIQTAEKIHHVNFTPNNFEQSPINHKRRENLNKLGLSKEMTEFDMINQQGILMRELAEFFAKSEGYEILEQIFQKAGLVYTNMENHIVNLLTTGNKKAIAEAIGIYKKNNQLRKIEALANNIVSISNTNKSKNKTKIIEPTMEPETKEVKEMKEWMNQFNPNSVLKRKADKDREIKLNEAKKIQEKLENDAQYFVKFKNYPEKLYQFTSDMDLNGIAKVIKVIKNEYVTETLEDILKSFEKVLEIRKETDELLEKYKDTSLLTTELKNVSETAATKINAAIKKINTADITPDVKAKSISVLEKINKTSASEDNWKKSAKTIYEGLVSFEVPSDIKMSIISIINEVIKHHKHLKEFVTAYDNDMLSQTKYISPSTFEPTIAPDETSEVENDLHDEDDHVEFGDLNVDEPDSEVDVAMDVDSDMDDEHMDMEIQPEEPTNFQSEPMVDTPIATAPESTPRTDFNFRNFLNTLHNNFQSEPTVGSDVEVEPVSDDDMVDQDLQDDEMSNDKHITIGSDQNVDITISVRKVNESNEHKNSNDAQIIVLKRLAGIK